MKLSALVLLFSAVVSGSLAWSSELRNYEVVAKKPQDRRNFVQGLEIVDGKLYVSSGNYGQSRLMRYDFADMKLEVSKSLNRRLFAEGLTILGERLYQLTWRERMMLVFDKRTMEALEWFPIPGQGWGLTNDGSHLIYTDGGAQLHFMDPEERKIRRSVTVMENGHPLPKLNELEWIDGKIWANIWQTDRIVIIDPESGKVEGSLDMTGLLPAAERHPNTNVLNGIARDPTDGGIWITGKYWPWLYKIELSPPD